MRCDRYSVSLPSSQSVSQSSVSANICACLMDASDGRTDGLSQTNGGHSVNRYNKSSVQPRMLNAQHNSWVCVPAIRSTHYILFSPLLYQSSPPSVLHHQPSHPTSNHPAPSLEYSNATEILHKAQPEAPHIATSAQRNPRLPIIPQRLAVANCRARCSHVPICRAKRPSLHSCAVHNNRLRNCRVRFAQV